LAPGVELFSRSVLFALISRVTVEALTPMPLAIFLAEMLSYIPASMAHLSSFVMCFPFDCGTMTSFLAKESRAKQILKGQMTKGQPRCKQQTCPRHKKG
jgi:hypothetical protein